MRQTGSPMQPDVMKDLVRVLEEELKLYDVLSDCLKRQQGALVRLDQPRLEALTLELEALLSEVRRVSEARVRMVSRIAVGLGRKGESLRDLAEAAPEPHRARFAALRKDLLSGVKRMEGLAGSSRSLIEESTGHINTFVKVLAGLSGPSPVYANPRPGQSPALMDRSA